MVMSGARVAVAGVRQLCASPAFALISPVAWLGDSFCCPRFAGLNVFRSPSSLEAGVVRSGGSGVTAEVASEAVAVGEGVLPCGSLWVCSPVHRGLAWGRPLLPRAPWRHVLRSAYS